MGITEASYCAGNSDIDYRHLAALTDRTGMLQFSNRSNPDAQSGYTVDDNARALMVALKMDAPGRSEWCKVYCDYLHLAQKEDGGWNNLRLGEYFAPGLDSEDSRGRAFLACCAASQCDLEDVSRAGYMMMQKSHPVVMRMRSPRALAYVLLGLCWMIRAPGDHQDRFYRDASLLNQSLQNLYRKNRTPGWRWFENSVTYCNGILPQALFSFYEVSGDPGVLQTARESLAFINEQLFCRGYLNIVGNRGWWIKDRPCPVYDQQPVDACSIAMACAQALHATGQREYLELVKLADAWFGGKNINGSFLYDPGSGGCFDGLTPEGVNLNQGAESLLALLMTSQLMVRLQIRPVEAGLEKANIS